MSLIINANSRLNKALDLHPQVLAYIISLNPHEIWRLHNPLMRHIMPLHIIVCRIGKLTQVPLAAPNVLLSFA